MEINIEEQVASTPSFNCSNWRTVLVNSQVRSCTGHIVSTSTPDLFVQYTLSDESFSNSTPLPSLTVLVLSLHQSQPLSSVSPLYRLISFSFLISINSSYLSQKSSIIIQLLSISTLISRSIYPPRS